MVEHGQRLVARQAAVVSELPGTRQYARLERSRLRPAQNEAFDQAVLNSNNALEDRGFPVKTKFPTLTNTTVD
jgi:hypothetical protein